MIIINSIISNWKSNNGSTNNTISDNKINDSSRNNNNVNDDKNNKSVSSSNNVDLIFTSINLFMKIMLLILLIKDNLKLTQST